MTKMIIVGICVILATVISTLYGFDIGQNQVAEANAYRSFTPQDRANAILERQTELFKRQVKALERIAVSMEKLTPVRYAGE